MLSSRFFRSSFVHRYPSSIRPRHSRLKPTRLPSYLSRTSSREYRVVTYRQLLTSWNTISLWFWSPLFYYNVAGIGILCGGFYLYHLERVPVRKAVPNIRVLWSMLLTSLPHIDVRTLTLQHRLSALGGAVRQSVIPAAP